MSHSSFIDPSARVADTAKVWHFAVILAGVRVGEDASIGSHSEVGRGSVVGERTRIGKGVFLPPNSNVGDDVFIGPGTVFTDDKYPRAGNKDYNAQPPQIEDGASIGAGCVILPGIRIGKRAVIGAGSVVTSDVAAFTMVYGEPARTKGHVVESFKSYQQQSPRALAASPIVQEQVS